MVVAAAALAETGHYLQWGWFSISLTNLVIIGAMLVIFVLALLLPFPRGGPAEPAPVRTRSSADPDGPRP